MYESTSQASPRFDASCDSGADAGYDVGLDVGFRGAPELLRAWRDGRRPDPELTVSAWADSHRLLSPRGANEAGRWRTSRTPYLREIMDALSPMHPAQRVVVMKGAQIGATEAGNNWIGYVIHHAPGPMLAVQPTVELAKRFSQQRVDPLIDESPALRDKVSPARSRDAGNTVLSKEFPGGILVMTGANSAVGLRSMPVRYLFLDEVDAYPLSADAEGEPVALAEARTRTYSWRRKVFLASTPTVSHDNVKQTYLNWTAAADLRQPLAYETFQYGGITFVNYRGTDDGSTVAIAADKCRFFPVGANGVFRVAQSPAETFDFVNTPGLDVYAMTIPDRDRNASVRIELYSYPLFICTRPEMLQRAKKA